MSESAHATALLYMSEFDVETCGSRVLDVSATSVVLDRTCFYPRGGGQDWDTGVLHNASGRYEVTEVRLDDDAQVHHVGAFTSGEFTTGEVVTGEVDSARRAVNTRLHSAAHVIDLAVDNLGLDWVPTKGQHYPNLSAVEYAGTWDAEQGEQLREHLEAETRRLIAEGSSNEIRFVPVDEMHTLCRHVPANIPENKPARVVLYGDFGIPCGGTHVRDIRQVGVVSLVKLKEKKGVIRATYAVEGIAGDGGRL